jgi:hypothetical protein
MIGEPLSSGKVQSTTTLSPSIIVTGASGFSGVFAAKITNGSDKALKSYSFLDLSLKM